MRRIPWISTTWEEGRLFDRWMIVHFISGVAGGFSNVLFDLTTRGIYALGLSLLLLWEVGEHLQRVRESWENRVIDLAVGVAGISVALWCAVRMSDAQEVVAFAVSTAAAVLGSVLGGLASLARKRAAPADRGPIP
jgi:hypothetical protein